jgi:modulator of FtsH protease HflK
MSASYKRPAQLAFVCLILSVIFFGIAFFLGQWSNSLAISATGWFFLSGALIWFVLTIQFYQRSLAEQEKLDIGLLEKDRQSSTIFQATTERGILFSAAQSRLEILEKWFLPIFAGAIAIYQAGIGLYLLSTLRFGVNNQPKEPLFCAILLVAMAFLSFLLSRYATGMSSQSEWKPLRAGGSSMLASALLCFALAVVLALVHLFGSVTFKSTLPDIVSLVIAVLLVVLGAETGLNLVFDIYRPRIKGQYSRSAFDSRLLGIINEPGGILRSAADAIDYQFGFTVSQTWFYKLLEQAIVPLTLFAVVTLYLMSCVIVVQPDEQAIIEHFGNPVRGPNDIRIIGSGLTFKWPWPIDIAYKYPITAISEIGIGYKEDKTAKDYEPNRPKLWGQKHYQEEYHLLVAADQTSSSSSSKIAPVSLVIAAVPIQYRIKNLYNFIYNHNEPVKLLEAICYRELTRYAAGSNLEVENEVKDQQSMLGAGRIEAGRILTERIQSAADQEKLGIEIVYVGLQGVHPPVEVAADYEKVIGAIQQKQKAILDAQAEQNSILSKLAGSVDKAEKLYDLAKRYSRAVDANSQQEKEALGKELDAAFEKASGDIFEKFKEAQSYAYQKETSARAVGEQFANQLKAYRAAPEIYLREQWLAMYEEALKNIRKYVVVADQNDRQTTIIDLQEKMTESIYKNLEEGLKENNGR